MLRVAFCWIHSATVAAVGFLGCFRVRSLHPRVSPSRKVCLVANVDENAHRRANGRVKRRSSKQRIRRVKVDGSISTSVPSRKRMSSPNAVLRSPPKSPPRAPPAHNFSRAVVRNAKKPPWNDCTNCGRIRVMTWNTLAQSLALDSFPRAPLASLSAPSRGKQYDYSNIIGNRMEVKI